MQKLLSADLPARHKLSLCASECLLRRRQVSQTNHLQGVQASFEQITELLQKVQNSLEHPVELDFCLAHDGPHLAFPIFEGLFGVKKWLFF